MLSGFSGKVLRVFQEVLKGLVSISKTFRETERQNVFNKILGLRMLRRLDSPTLNPKP